jgi:hypothetical protein
MTPEVPRRPTEWLTLSLRAKIAIDIAGNVLYNPPIMDSLNVFRIPAVALSSLLFWNWWAAAAQ